jgi:NADH dehydrogenase FAD-containing subunit
VLALGSTTSAPLPGIAEHAVRLNNLHELRAASQQVRGLAERGGRILVAGGGMTGIEMATELAERFPTLRITLATNGAFGRDYTPTARAYLRAVFQHMGIDLREHASIGALEAGVAHLADGDTIQFDMCVWSGGFVASPLARAAGLATDGSGRVTVDPTLRALGHPEVYVAGDAAAVPFGAGTLRMGCVAALPLGAHAGDNIARQARGHELRPFDMGFVIRCISLGRRNGLVQTTDRDDTARQRFFQHKTAAWIKEAICRMTFETVRWEMRSSQRLYAWPAGPAQSAHAPVALDV